VVRDELWLVMEYIQGVTLTQAVSRFELTQDKVAAIFYQVLEAVAYMHSRGIMHNDIHPGNVMLGCNGEVKLVDLGLSTEIEKANAKVSLRISAPELLKGEEYDSGTDIWAVGVTLYFALFREFIFCNKNDTAFRELMLALGKPRIPIKPTLHPDMADFLDQCFTINRHERPSATDLLKHDVFQCIYKHSAQIVATLARAGLTSGETGRKREENGKKQSEMEEAGKHFLYQPKYQNDCHYV
jgi:serine/threonine protein kinase